jgi:hypothetical protein
MVVCPMVVSKPQPRCHKSDIRDRVPAGLDRTAPARSGSLPQAHTATGQANPSAPEEQPRVS